MDLEEIAKAFRYCACPEYGHLGVETLTDPSKQRAIAKREPVPYPCDKLSSLLGKRVAEHMVPVCNKLTDDSLLKKRHK